MEELSDPRDQPTATVPRCKRSQGPGDVLLFESVCSQIIWVPGAGTVPEGSGPRGLSLEVANWGCGCHGPGEEEEEEGNLPLVPPINPAPLKCFNQVMHAGFGC